MTDIDEGRWDGRMSDDMMVVDGLGARDQKYPFPASRQFPNPPNAQSGAKWTPYDVDYGNVKPMQKVIGNVKTKS